MKLYLRTLLLACLVAVAASARANDYYFRGSSTLWLTEDYFKFTQIPSNDGTETYQLLLTEISGTFRIGGETKTISELGWYVSDPNQPLSNWDVNLGYVSGYTDENTSIVSDDIASTDGITLNLKNYTYSTDTSDENFVPAWEGDNTFSNDKLSYNIKVADDTYLKHVVLTLKVSDSGATLNIARITNDNVADGVPTYLYVESDWINAQKYLPSMRLYKDASDVNHYKTKVLNYLGGYISVKEIPMFNFNKNSHLDETKLVITEVTEEGYKTSAVCDGAEGQPDYRGYLLYEGGRSGKFVDTSDIYSATVEATEGGNNYKGWFVNVSYNTLTNVVVKLYYDITAEHTGTSDVTNTELHITGDTSPVAAADTETETPTSTSGIISFEFKYAEQKDNGEWKTATLTKQSDNVDYVDGNGYVTYSTTLSFTDEFNAAFYVQEIIKSQNSEGENSESTIDFKSKNGGTWDETKEYCGVEGYWEDNDYVSTWDVVPETDKTIANAQEAANQALKEAYAAYKEALAALEKAEESGDAEAIKKATEVYEPAQKAYATARDKKKVVDASAENGYLNTAVTQFCKSGEEHSAVRTSTAADALYYAAKLAANSQTINVTVTFKYNITDPDNSILIITTDNGSITYSGVSVVPADVEVEDAPVEYYNLSGVRVDGSIPGLYIRRQGNKVSKVIIK
jgi:hypothetical protein